jgi:hypothetical protein
MLKVLLCFLYWFLSPFSSVIISITTAVSVFETFRPRAQDTKKYAAFFVVRYRWSGRKPTDFLNIPMQYLNFKNR